VTPDNPNLLSGFKNKVRPKVTTVSYFHPVERGPAFLAIKVLKWCHLNAFLITIIVRKLSQFQTLVPLLRKRDETSSQHIFEHLIYPFCSIVGLGMIS
jgi:hypothetical protein